MNKNESKYYNTSLLMDEALLLILENKDFEFISVKEICKKAGVSRSTFYLHYDTMNDLLDETLERLTKRFYASFKVSSEAIKDKIINNSQLDELVFLKPDYLKPYINFINENKKLYSLALSKPLNFNATEYFDKLYCSFFEPIMNRFNINKSLQKYVVTYYCNGIISIVNKWLKEGTKESPDELCDIIMWCLGKNVEKFN